MKLILILVLCSLVVPHIQAQHFDYSEARQLAIQAGGRKKPLDTFALESMQNITGRRSLTLPQTGQRFTPMDFLCSVWFDEAFWQSAPLVLVSHRDLRAQLGLATDQKRFSWEVLEQNAALDTYYKQVRSKHARKEELAPLEKEAELVLGRMFFLEAIGRGEALRMVPSAGDLDGKWTSINAMSLDYSRSATDRLNGLLTQVSKSFLNGDKTGFVSATETLRKELAALAPGSYPSSSVIQREIHYHQLHPFRWAWIFYLGAFLFLSLARARWAVGLGNGLFSIGIGMHIYGFVLRGLIAGRAPVTNMYESVVWVSLGVTVLAFVYSRIYKTKSYLLAAVPIAVFGLILADLLPSVLDPKIGPLPPVLRDNFWLVTHVLTITIGYAAFALAFALGHVVLALSLVKNSSAFDKSHLHLLVYRMLQFGILLLAVGTILGGVWANYSWGRFWGWDPKETWALIALLLYIFALHGRIAGWWGSFGLSVAAVVCFNGVLMAWYGVNFVLGKGLHSYGFGTGGSGWVAAFIILDLVFVLVCIERRVRSLAMKDEVQTA